MRIYISGPLQGSTNLRAARALYEAIAEIVAPLGFDSYVPHLHTDPEHAQSLSASEVFRRDVRELLRSDVVVAHVGAPSTGVGAELALAAQAGLAIVGIARKDEKVSRFAAGLIGDAGGTIFEFAGLQELSSSLPRHLPKVHSLPAARSRLAV